MYYFLDLDWYISQEHIQVTFGRFQFVNFYSEINHLLFSFYSIEYSFKKYFLYFYQDLIKCTKILILESLVFELSFSFISDH